MRKINLFISLFILGLTAFNSQAQTSFSEDFNGVNPFANWTLVNVDGNTPNAAVAYVNDAWVVREDFDSTGVGDSVAVSTSWYTPAGSANDYMITPMIVTTANPVLEFDAKAQDPNFADGYELRVSTTTPDVAGLLNNPPLFTTNAENGAWTRRSINLSAYANDTIYLGWRNNSTDQFLLLIDNIKVYEPVANNVGISAIVRPTNGCFLSANDSVEVSIENFGTSSTSIIPVAYRLNGGPLQTDTFAGNLAAGATVDFLFGTSSVNLATPGVYQLEVYTDLPADGNRNNDTLRTFIVNGLKPLPYFEDFNGFQPLQTGLFGNGWSTQRSGNFLWVTNQDTTGTVATGPNSDRSGNGIYFYTEASTPAVPGEVAALVTPCVDLSTNPNFLFLDFWYHMYGADITTLYVQVEDQGSWVTVDSLVGQQQTSNAAAYQQMSVNLSNFISANSEIRARFITVRGNGFNADIAIDDVEFRDQTIGLDDNTQEEIALELYPNPSNLPYTNLRFGLNSSANANVLIMDISGKVVYQENLGTLSEGEQRFRLNTSNLENGLYFMNLQLDDKRISKKLSIAR